jgi:uncharacterized phage protein gp47/JayE
MVLQGVSTRKVSQITQALSRVKVGKDALSRTAGKLEEELQAWRERNLEGRQTHQSGGGASGEVSALNLATAVLLRVTEEWSLRKYLDMAPLEAMMANPQH